ncbi:MAG: hypothetical protein B7Z02_05930 [Rhodobacterales bacterium 32-67-9]|nr:MAG: hypothetical protein B7Z02_05930 [Rhodobacterales bacterium 32-67-9]
MSAEQPRDVSRIVSWVMRIVLLVLFAFLYGVYSGVTRGPAYAVISSLLDTTRQVLEQVPNLLGTEPVDFLQPARQPGAGVTINETDDGRLVAISGFFDGQNGIRLMRRDGTVVASWTLSFSRDFPETGYLRSIAPKTDWNVDLHGMVVKPDGSVLVNYEYAGLIKLDRCGRTQWTLEHPTHHSIEPAEGGGYWVPGLRFLIPGAMEDSFPPFTDMRNAREFFDNLILKVTEDAFAPAFPQFRAGDLLLSLREHNMLLVVDPVTWRVKWSQVGPWRRQHDPRFMADGTITLFNNNAYRTILGEGDESPVDAPRVSEIGRLDPKTGQYGTAWGNRPGQEMLSVIRGKEVPTAGGGFIVTEFEAGRAFETDAAGRIVWEYINRYDETRVAEITEARSYPASYFTVSDWSCPTP